MTAQEFIDELTYSCYQFNRLRSPEISPDRWSKIFQNADTLERRLQQEVQGLRHE